MLKRGVIYLRENECPKCRGELILVSIEKSINAMNEYGMPIFGESIDDIVDMHITCKKCGHKYEAECDAMSFKIKRELPVLDKPKIKEFNPFSI